MNWKTKHELFKQPEMKVLVTGGNGLLGSHVVKELLIRKYTVRILVRKGSDIRALKNQDVEIFFGRITNSNDVLKSVEGCDFVIHAAARTAQFPNRLEDYENPNINSTKLYMEACKHAGIKRFLYVSTANCFGNGTFENPGNEDTHFLPWLQKSGYAYSKFLAQKMVLKEALDNGFDVVVVNPTFVIGANDFKPSSGKIFKHVLKKRIVFYPPGGKNFVDAETAANGIVNALEKGRKGQCYLLAGENLSYLDFFRTTTTINQQKSVFIPIPGIILLFAGLVGDVMVKIFGLKTGITQTNARLLCLKNYYSAKKARAELQFEITPIKESIAKAVMFFNKVY